MVRIVSLTPQLYALKTIILLYMYNSIKLQLFQRNSLCLYTLIFITNLPTLQSSTSKIILLCAK